MTRPMPCVLLAVLLVLLLSQGSLGASCGGRHRRQVGQPTLVTTPSPYQVPSIVLSAALVLNVRQSVRRLRANLQQLQLLGSMSGWPDKEATACCQLLTYCRTACICTRLQPVPSLLACTQLHPVHLFAGVHAPSVDPPDCPCQSGSWAAALAATTPSCCTHTWPGGGHRLAAPSCSACLDVPGLQLAPPCLRWSGFQKPDPCEVRCKCQQLAAWKSVQHYMHYWT
jgi:hypothetical protein